MSISALIKYRREMFYLDLSKRLTSSVDSLNRIHQSNHELDREMKVIKQTIEALEN